MKMNKKDIENRIKKQELSNGDNEASNALFAKIQDIRIRDGYKSEYDCLVELGIIEEVIAPPNAVNLLDTMKKKEKLVNDAMEDQTIRAKIEQLQKEFKEQSKGESILI